MDREYRAVRCMKCIWQDYYDTRMRSSYPPRCPECGGVCDHEFFVAIFSFRERRLLGRDRGIIAVFGDPKQRYKNLRDRMSRRG